jgi:hypothetical protein
MELLMKMPPTTVDCEARPQGRAMAWLTSVSMALLVPTEMLVSQLKRNESL